MYSSADVEDTAQQPRDDDPHRPRFHFLPPAGWMNDPNGLSLWGDSYHLFFQYNPYAARHEAIHWGHAVSSDLVTWSHLPPALAPTPGSPDEDGCWSGCAVDNDGVPTLIYSGAQGESQLPCLATSDDGLLSWQKYAGNPLLAAPPAGLDLVAFRDHAVWRENDTWYQLVGSGIRGAGGAALLYSSNDLLSWSFLHPLLVGDFHATAPVWTGSMWECPDFFPLGERHVLMISVWDQSTLYYSAVHVGHYRGRRLEVEQLHKLDHGDGYFYAPQSLRDKAGRRVVFGWLREGRPLPAQVQAGWSGAMSLPRVLTLGQDGTVHVQPLPELASLRGAHTAVEPQPIASGRTTVLSNVAGDRLEIQAQLAPAPGGRVGLALRRSPDQAEQTVIWYDAATAELSVDRTHASLDEDTDRTTELASLTLEAGAPLRLQVFLDASVLEIFADQRLSLSTRIYPTRGDSHTVALLAEGGDARLEVFDAWELQSIW